MVMLFCITSRRLPLRQVFDPAAVYLIQVAGCNHTGPARDRLVPGVHHCDCVISAVRRQRRTVPAWHMITPNHQPQSIHSLLIITPKQSPPRGTRVRRANYFPAAADAPGHYIAPGVNVVAGCLAISVVPSVSPVNLW